MSYSQKGRNYVEERLTLRKNSRLTLRGKPRMKGNKRTPRKTLKANNVSELVKFYESDRNIEAPTHDSSIFARTAREYNSTTTPTRPTRPARPKPRSDIIRRTKFFDTQTPQRPPKRPKTKPKSTGIADRMKKFQPKENQVTPTRPSRGPGTSRNIASRYENAIENPEEKDDQVGTNFLVPPSPGASKLTSMFEDGGVFEKKVEKSIDKEDIPAFRNEFFLDAQKRREEARKRREMEKQEEQDLKTESQVEEEVEEGMAVVKDGKVEVTVEYLQQLTHQFNTFNENIGSLTELNQHLMKKVKEIEESSSNNDKSHRKSMEEMKKGYDDLKLEKESQEKKLEQRIEELDLKILDLEKEKDELTIIHDRAREEIEKKNSTVMDSLNTRIQNTEKQLDLKMKEMNRKVQTLKQEQLDLKNRNEKLQSEVRRGSKTKKESILKLEETNKKLTLLKEENRKLKSESLKKSVEEDATSKLVQMKKEVIDLKAENVKLRMNHEVLKSRFRVSQENTKKSAAKQKEDDERMEELEHKILEMGMRSSEIKRENERLKVDMVSEKSHYEKLLGLKNGEVEEDELIKITESLRNQVTRLKKEKMEARKSYKKTTEKMELENEEMKKSFEVEKEELVGEMGSLQNELMKLQEEKEKVLKWVEEEKENWKKEGKSEAKIPLLNTMNNKSEGKECCVIL